MWTRSLTKQCYGSFCIKFRRYQHYYGSCSSSCVFLFFDKSSIICMKHPLQNLFYSQKHGEDGCWLLFFRHYFTLSTRFDQKNQDTADEKKFEEKQPKQDISKESDDDDEDDKKMKDQTLSRFEKAKYLLKKYGVIFIGIEFILYTSSFVALYFLIKTGVDVRTILDFLHLNADSELIKKGSTIMIVFVINKLLSPIRLTVALLLTPIVGRWLKRRGLWTTIKKQIDSKQK